MEIIKYIFFGVLTTIINILSFTVLDSISIPYKLANVVAWFLSVIFAFYTNKVYVFKSINKDKNSLKKETLTFFLARLGSLIFDTSFMILLIDFMNINKLIAKVITNVLVVVINYILSKFIIFKKEK